MAKPSMVRKLAYCCGAGLIAATLGTALAPRPAAADDPSAPDFYPPPSIPPGHSDDEEVVIGGLRKLTQPEIQRLRFLELRGMRQGATGQAEAVTVKLDQKVIDDFLIIMEGDARYSGEKNKGEFRKLTPAQKVHFIAAEKGTRFADRIHITSDPEVFVRFRKKIMPAVLQGCSTVGCHGSGSGEEVKFHLFKDPKKSPETTYANFVVLNDLRVNDLPLINRSQPGNSLLLTYMLPQKEVKPELRHPGKVEYRPIFSTRTKSGFKDIENWITSLKHPAEDYGIHLIKPTEITTSAPSDGAPPPP